MLTPETYSAIFQTHKIKFFAKIAHDFQLQEQKVPSEMFERVLNTLLNTSTLSNLHLYYFRVFWVHSTTVQYILKTRATSRRQFTFYHHVPKNSCYSFYRPRKDERLSRSWSHPMVLNTGPLDCESSALTTKPLLLCPSISKTVKKYKNPISQVSRRCCHFVCSPTWKH